MNGSEDLRTRPYPTRGWVRWRASRLSGAAGDSPWMQKERVLAFRFMLIVSIAALSVLVYRGFSVGGPSPWFDAANTLCCVLVLVLLKLRPEWLRPLSWTVLVCFFLNAMEGPLAAARPIAPYLMLLPLLVLYGALLGDGWMVVSAMVVVMALYIQAAVTAWPMTMNEMLFLTNMMFVTIVASLTALGLWLQHRRMVENLNTQALDLRRELDARARLHAILFHDLSNPLTALLSTTALGRMGSREPMELLKRVEGMANRMHGIIKAARSMESGQEAVRTIESVEGLHKQLCEIFAPRLEAKEQRLVLTEGGNLTVRTSVPVLSHSVLGNIVNNAIKFSPRGATIDLVARADDDQVRIEVLDRGGGFSPEALRHGARGEEPCSRPGTEGEAGSGYGMRIASLCLERMDGALEVRNRRSGGGAVAVLLPAAARGPQ